MFNKRLSTFGSNEEIEKSLLEYLVSNHNYIIFFDAPSKAACITSTAVDVTNFGTILDSAVKPFTPQTFERDSCAYVACRIVSASVRKSKFLWNG